MDEDLFEINELPIVFEDENEWDSEDELPLSTIRQRELTMRKPIWTNSSDHCLQNMKEFNEDIRPNIPVEKETPIDVFLCLFPKSLIKEIVFQTNLYALQKCGNTSFKQTCSKKVIPSCQHYDGNQTSTKI